MVDLVRHRFTKIMMPSGVLSNNCIHDGSMQQNGIITLASERKPSVSATSAHVASNKQENGNTNNGFHSGSFEFDDLATTKTDNSNSIKHPPKCYDGAINYHSLVPKLEKKKNSCSSVNKANDPVLASHSDFCTLTNSFDVQQASANNTRETVVSEVVKACQTHIVKPSLTEPCGKLEKANYKHGVKSTSKKPEFQPHTVYYPCRQFEQDATILNSQSERSVIPVKLPSSSAKCCDNLQKTITNKGIGASSTWHMPDTSMCNVESHEKDDSSDSQGSKSASYRPSLSDGVSNRPSSLTNGSSRQGEKGHSKCEQIVSRKHLLGDTTQFSRSDKEQATHDSEISYCFEKTQTGRNNPQSMYQTASNPATSLSTLATTALLDSNGDKHTFSQSEPPHNDYMGLALKQWPVYLGNVLLNFIHKECKSINHSNCNTNSQNIHNVEKRVLALGRLHGLKSHVDRNGSTNVTQAALDIGQSFTSSNSLSDSLHTTSTSSVSSPPSVTPAYSTLPSSSTISSVYNISQTDNRSESSFNATSNATDLNPTLEISSPDISSSSPTNGHIGSHPNTALEMQAIASRITKASNSVKNDLTIVRPESYCPCCHYHNQMAIAASPAVPAGGPQQQGDLITTRNVPQCKANFQQQIPPQNEGSATTAMSLGYYYTTPSFPSFLLSHKECVSIGLYIIILSCGK